MQLFQIYKKKATTKEGTFWTRNFLLQTFSLPVPQAISLDLKSTWKYFNCEVHKHVTLYLVTSSKKLQQPPSEK